MKKKTVMTGVCLAFGALLLGGSADAQQERTSVVRAHEAALALAGETGLAPEPWLQEDPGSRAYAAAREILNARRYQEAAEAFYRLRQDYARSGYLAASYYYQAFALSRSGNRSDLREARDVLTEMLDRYGETTTAGDARELMVRVESQLASQGDARAAQAIAQQAADPCGPDQEIRLAALSALMNMNADRARPILREVLKDKDACSAELRSQAIFLIAQNMDDEAVDIFLDLAHRDPDPDPGVRAQAVFWLSEAESEVALDVLEDLLRESEDPEVQENALFALANLDSPRAGEVLREFIERDDVSTEIRMNALHWIGHSHGGAEYLRSHFHGLETADLKEAAIHAIAQGETDETRAWLVERALDAEEDVEIRTNALFWAAQSGAFSADELRELFNSFDDPELKEGVIFAASDRDDREVVDFLMEVAEDKENGELREQAIFWLGQSKDPRVPEFLLRIIGR